MNLAKLEELYKQIQIYKKNRMGMWVVGLFDRAFAALSVIVFVQMPLFMQQYHGQLLGHIAELKFQIFAMEEAAASGGKILPEYVEHFMSSGDPIFMKQGIIMSNMVDRMQNLSIGWNSFSEASLFSRPIVFLEYVNWDIAKSSLENFQPGIPLSLEGAFYAAIGLVMGSSFFYLLKKISEISFLKKKNRSITE